MKKQHFIFYFSFEQSWIGFEQDLGEKTLLKLEHGQLGVLLRLLGTGVAHEVMGPVFLAHHSAGVVSVLA